MNTLARHLWRDVRDDLVERGPGTARSWIEQLRPRSFRHGVFEFAVPNEVVRVWIDRHHRRTIERAMQAQTGSPIRVRLVVDRRADGGLRGAPAPGVGPTSRRARGLGLSGAGEPYVVVPEARLAHAAVRRALEDPGCVQPLYLYGDAGVGKSALVEHLVSSVLSEGGTRRAVVRATAERFSRHFVAALKERDLPAFRGRWLAADVFVFEEFHRLRGKAASQAEFLRILLYHLQRGRPVILTARHPPHEVFLLEERLRSHVLSGLVVRLPDPGDPSRLAILRAHAGRLAPPVPDETLERIVRRVPGSVGRQVRFLEKVAAFSASRGVAPTIEALEERFPQLGGKGAGELDFRGLLSRVAAEFGVDEADVASNRKARRATLARHVLIYVAVEVLGVPARRVLRSLGNLSPSTTSYARRRVAERRREDPAFDHRLRRLVAELRQGQRLLF